MSEPHTQEKSRQYEVAQNETAQRFLRCSPHLFDTLGDTEQFSHSKGTNGEDLLHLATRSGSYQAHFPQ